MCIAHNSLGSVSAAWIWQVLLLMTQRKTLALGMRLR